jgi:type III pantothenate kinase
MNVIAIDIGNTNITIGLFLNDREDFVKTIPGGTKGKLTNILTAAWKQIPLVKDAKVKKTDGVIIVSSCKPAWTKIVREVCRDKLNEKIKVLGKDIPLPIEMGVDNPSEVGTDRVVAAAAAFAVVEDAVIVADFGTAVSIDLVDEQGIFMGGIICPGFELAAQALESGTAKLPKIKVQKPKGSYGANTIEAINAGLYYSAVGLLETITRKYAEELGRWPQTIATGAAAEIIKQDCDFVDSWVPNLVVKGIVLAYKKYLDDQAALAEIEDKTRKDKSSN